MNTHETYVSLEVAKLLKQAGFDWKVNHWYSRSTRLMDDSQSSPLNWNESGVDGEYSAPTLDVAQKWLREVKGLFICVIPEIKDYHATWVFYICCNEQGLLYEDEDCFLTYEEAQEAGIKKALEIILEKGE